MGRSEYIVNVQREKIILNEKRLRSACVLGLSKRK